MNKKRILVTGSNGFIGRHLIQYTRKHYPSAEVAAIARQLVHKEQRVNFYLGDCADPTFIRDVLLEWQPQCVFHLAGNLFSKNFQALQKDNVAAFYTIADTLLQLNLNPKVVVVGTAAEYGHVALNQLPVREDLPAAPISFYGLTKLWQTELATYFSKKGLDVRVARLFNVIGSGISDNLIAGSLFQQLKKNNNIVKIGSTHTVRDFMDIQDVCSALDAILNKGCAGEIYNICSSRKTSIKELLDCFELEIPNFKIIQDPNAVKKVDASIVYGDNQKLKALGWEPQVNLETSVHLLLADL